jgi:hypothetical protein
MSLLRLIDAVHPFIGGDFEAPLYVSFARAELEQVAFVVAKNSPKHAVNFTTISIINKGSDGLGNDVLASFNNDLNDPNSIDFVANQPTVIILSNATVPKGVTIAVTKVDNNAAVDLGFSSLVINERRF